AILQQEILELSGCFHTAEVEARSLFLQLVEFKWTFNEMQKDVEKAHRLQEQFSELQHVNTIYFSFQKTITQDNIHEVLEKALHRENEARLLLQEHEQQLQVLSSRLELHTSADTDRSQDSNVSLMLRFLSDAMEEMRRRGRILNHQEKLLKETELERQWLREALQEAERALQQAAKDKELIINHMKAVDATLRAVRDQAVLSGAAAATLLPSLQLEILSEEAVRGRPEAIEFQVRV
ncbi:CC171 protein, partial [Leucopsar rothschildi]|nr:CC171 protein [Leucopsar rothschildi]